MSVEHPFNQRLIDYLEVHRTTGVTEAFQFFSLMGEIEGYVLLISAIFVFWDRRIAVQSALVVSVAMTLNHLLKIWLQIPRPFVLDGLHFEKWAVSATNAAELAAEYSTPSGHAMAASAFYGFLMSRTSASYLRYGALAAILLVGISRPIIGVHFLEDILLGWVLGGFLAWFAASQVHNLWDRLCAASPAVRVTLALFIATLVWLATVSALTRSLSDYPTAFTTYLGFLTGIILVAPFFKAPVSLRLELWPGLGIWSCMILLIAICTGLIEWVSSTWLLGKPGGRFVFSYFSYCIIPILGFGVASKVINSSARH